jgi:hypothetical protein
MSRCAASFASGLIASACAIYDARVLLTSAVLHRRASFASSSGTWLCATAFDVYGSLNPDSVPVVSPGDTYSAPINNNQGSFVQYTSNGNPRLVPVRPPQTGPGSVVRSSEACELLAENDLAPTTAAEGVHDGSSHSQWGQWDRYDTPTRGDYSSGFQVSQVLVGDATGGSLAADASGGKVTGSQARKEQLTASDYRAIGKFRLMESIDINKYMQLRRELAAWSAAFKRRVGHTPALSDVRDCGEPRIYAQFCEYIEARNRMNGLVREVCGTEIDNVEELQKVTNAGKDLVEQLNLARKSAQNAAVAAAAVSASPVLKRPSSPPSPPEQRLKTRSPPKPLPQDPPGAIS